MMSNVNKVSFDLAGHSMQTVPEQLPGLCYHDTNIFDKEMRIIFSSSWQMICHENEIAKPGEYLTAKLGYEPIILFRDKNMKLRGYYNVCPHRGVKLLNGSGNCETIICPYHAWTFNHDGQLLNIPNKSSCFPDIQSDQVRLQPVSIDTWRGFVFANANLQATGLMGYLAKFPAFLDEYTEKYENLQLIEKFQFDERINWKILVENYVEDYHFGIVHPETLKSFDFKNVRTLPTGDHCRVYMPYRKQKPRGECKYPWASAGASWQGYIFPGMMIQTAVNHVSVFRVLPISAERTIIEIPVYQTDSQIEKYPINLSLLQADVNNDMEEDFVICRMLQENVHSSKFHVSALAKEHELGVLHFYRTWQKYMYSGRI